MNLKTQKRIAAKVLKCSPKRVVFDTQGVADIKEAITRADLRSLVGSKLIVKAQKKGNSRSRARSILTQKRKGRQSGSGTRKGTHGARAPRKRTWVIKVRSQRDFIKELKTKGKVSAKTYTDLYTKVKSGYFRNKRHIKLHLEENKLFT
jgi:large subunit ribosomal protein L19e